MHKRSKLLIASCGLVLAACSSTPHIGGYAIDQSYQAVGQNSRVRHIVLHYTSSNTPTALKTLSQHQVSSHYVVSDEQPPKLYQLVPESRRAWHAGLSQWFEHVDLNTSSIGIEIVNPGQNAAGEWVPYSPAQIQVVIALVRDLVERHQIPAQNIVGHSDIAPQRKIDPGPLFPWEQLAHAGLGRWYSSHTAQHYTRLFEQHGMPTPLETKQLLQQAGYPLENTTDNTGWDKASQNTFDAFQAHFAPDYYQQAPQAHSLGILKALVHPSAPAP